MNEDLLRVLVVSYVEFTSKHSQMKLKEKLKEIGYYMWKRMIIAASFEPTKELEYLLYRITFVLLPGYINIERTLERKVMDDGTTSKDTFLIFENEPYWSKNLELPDEHADFSMDAITAGIIEVALKVSGFTAKVNTFNSGTSVNPRRVVFEIKVE